MAKKNVCSAKNYSCRMTQYSICKCPESGGYLICFSTTGISAMRNVVQP